MRNPSRQYQRLSSVLRASRTTRATTGALLVLAALASGCAKEEPVSRVAGGDPERGRLLVQQYQCAACHFIPEVQGPNGDAGPSLQYMGRLLGVADVPKKYWPLLMLVSVINAAIAMFVMRLFV